LNGLGYRITAPMTSSGLFQAGLGTDVGTLMGSAISTNLQFLSSAYNQLSDIVAVSMTETSSVPSPTQLFSTTWV
jgi:hypothetical protein